MDWETIDTAPKDGTPLLLFARAKHATAPVRIVGWYLQDLGWVEASFTHPVGIVPTHWQPLDDPPPTEDELHAYQKRREDFIAAWLEHRPKMTLEEISAIFEMRESLRETPLMWGHFRKVARVLAKGE